MARPSLQSFVPTGMSSAVFLAFVVTGALVLMILVSHLIAGFYDQRVRRTAALLRVGGRLRRGLGAFYGVARKPSAGGEPSPVASVTRVLRDMGDDHPTGRTWLEVTRRVSGGPFELVLPDGQTIDVDSSDAVIEGFAVISGPTSRGLREETMSVHDGQQVWVMGRLDLLRKGASTAYRTQEGRPRLVAPRSGRIGISKSPPSARWALLARAHRFAGWAALLALAAMHLTFWRKLDAKVYAEGIGATVHVTDLWEWLAPIVVVLIVVSWAHRVRRARDAA